VTREQPPEVGRCEFLTARIDQDVAHTLMIQPTRFLQCLLGRSRM
jgi:hypothetical protein